MEEIVNYFLFALNLIIFATVAFAALAYLILHLNKHTQNKSSESKNKNLPVYDILLDFHHRDIDHWYSWIKTQSATKQEEALQLLINYLSEPIDHKGLLTRDVLKVITNFSYDNSFEFLKGFSESALRNWHKNKAIASFYEQSLLSMMDLDSAQAASFILSQLESTRSDSSRDLAGRYMVSALTRLKDLSELKYSFKEISLNELYKLDFRIDSLDLLKLNDNNYNEVVSHCLRAMIDGESLENFPLFNYLFKAVLESKDLDDDLIQELLIDCFINSDLQNDSTQILLKYLKQEAFYISQNLIFKILNSVSPMNYKSIKHALIQRDNYSDSELELIEKQSLVVDTYEDLNANTFDFKIYSFDKPINCDPFLKEELEAMGNVVDVENKPCLKLVYGKSKLEKLYIAKVLASISERSLLVLDLENIINFGADLVKLDRVLSQDPMKIVFLKNLKSLISYTESKSKRKHSLKVFTLIKKFLKFSSSNFIACVDDNLEALVESNSVFKEFFDEHSAILLHSYTFDIPSLERKRGIYQAVLQHIQKTRTFDINSFEEMKENIQDQSHFEYMNFIYKFFHDSLLTFKKVLSVKKYNHLLKDKKVFGSKKPLLNLDYVS